MNRDDAEFNQQSVEFQNRGMKSQLQDAQANKTISIVTMTFLPATAVAAICSMDIFDWRQPDRVYVSRHFWIFWVVSIVLTGLVIGIFLIWKRRLHARARRQAREDEEEKAKKEEDDSEDDSAIPEEPKHGTSRRQQGGKKSAEQSRVDVEEKQSAIYQQEEREEQVRSSRRRSRHRSQSRRSRTTSREGRAHPGFSRTVSGLSFRGESNIV